MFNCCCFVSVWSCVGNNPIRTVTLVNVPECRVRIVQGSEITCISENGYYFLGSSSDIATCYNYSYSYSNGSVSINGGPMEVILSKSCTMLLILSFSFLFTQITFTLKHFQSLWNVWMNERYSLLSLIVMKQNLQHWQSMETKDCEVGQCHQVEVCVFLFFLFFVFLLNHTIWIKYFL